jgi:hypothetical protein
MKAALAAAVKAGVPLFYLEDESPDPLGHIPRASSTAERQALTRANAPPYVIRRHTHSAGP